MYDIDDDMWHISPQEASYRQKKQREFAKIKKKYLEKHPYCEVCLTQGLIVPAVDVHHIKARWRGNNDEDNLVALCRSCHNKIHGTSYKDAQFVKKIIRKIKDGH
jgi:5-methylcytosine-specific restriction endonuclease McrA